MPVPEGSTGEGAIRVSKSRPDTRRRETTLYNRVSRFAVKKNPAYFRRRPRTAVAVPPRAFARHGQLPRNPIHRAQHLQGAGGGRPGRGDVDRRGVLVGRIGDGRG